MGVAVSGFAEQGFEPVREAFEKSFSGQIGMGAALCVYAKGRPVIDLYGGFAGNADAIGWNEQTLAVIFSCTKGLISILAAQLVEAGKLDYSAPVSRYWPEFAQAGKHDTTVAQLLGHQAGLSAPRCDLAASDIIDWAKMVRLLEAQEPLWTPGTGYAYHAITHGWLAGELIRRITGKPIGAAFAEQIANPLQADAWIGLPEEMVHRLVPMQWAEDPAAIGKNAQPLVKGSPDYWLERALTLGHALPAGLVENNQGFNDPIILAAEIPGAGGVASARSMARIWSATVCSTDGVRLLDSASVRAATQVQTEGEPFFYVDPPWPKWGMGLQLDSEARRYLTPNGFGHDGAGGQVAFAEPELEIGFCFLTNLMRGQGDDRATIIVDALRRCTIDDASR